MFNFLQTQEPLSELTFLDVSRKLLLLLVLLSGQRGKPLHLLGIKKYLYIRRLCETLIGTKMYPPIWYA